MESKQMTHYDNICNKICSIPGIRFAGIVNKNGRKMAVGFSKKTSSLEKNVQKTERMFMEIISDLSTKKEFDNSSGDILGIISHQDDATIITIPHRGDLIMLSAELELDSYKLIQSVKKIVSSKIMEVMIK